MKPKEKEDLILVLSIGLIPFVMYPLSKMATWFGTYMSRWNTTAFGWAVTLFVCVIIMVFGLNAPEWWINYVHKIATKEVNQ